MDSIPHLPYTFGESTLSPEQLKYYKAVEKKLSRGEYAEIGENYGYIFCFIYKMLDKWQKSDFRRTYDHLTLISELYSESKKIKTYALNWANDCLLALGEYRSYLDRTEAEISSGAGVHQHNKRLNIQNHCKLDANPIDIINMMGVKKSQFVKRNQIAFKESLFEEFEKYSEKSQKSWFDMLLDWCEGKPYGPIWLFNGTPIFNKPSLPFNPISYYSMEKNIETLMEISRDAENLARERAGVPLIGQGWISETELFRNIEREFPETTVIQHGRPSWLGRQHFDIWMPNWKVAIEYHGDQHFKAVEIFGGTEGFNKTVERDARKESLSIINGVKLFIATKEDDHQELFVQIRNHVASIKSQRLVDQ